MSKVCVFQLTPFSINVLIGDCNKNKAVIYYKFSQEYVDIFEDGKYVNEQYIVSEIVNIYANASKKIRNLKDYKNIAIFSDRDLVYDSKEVTSIDASIEGISDMNFLNLLSMAKKEIRLSPSSTLLTILPNYYKNDEDKKFLSLDECGISNSFTMNYRYCTCDSNSYDKLFSLFARANISISLFIPSNVAVALYFSKRNDKLKSYVLIESNEGDTILSLCDFTGKVYSAVYLSIGVSELYQNIANTFNISYVEARKLVLTYGLDLRQYNFSIKLLNKQENDQQIVIKQDDLNKYIIEFFKKYVKEIQSGVDELNSISSTNIKPVFFFTGEINNIYGFMESYKNSGDSVQFYRSNCMCCLEQKFLPLLAVIDQSNYLMEISDKMNFTSRANTQNLMRGE